MVLRVIAALWVSSALLLAACTGDDPAAGDEDRPGDRGTEAAGRSGDPARCPLDALDRAESRVDVTLWHGLVGMPATVLGELAAQYNAAQDAVHVEVAGQGDYEELFAKFTAASRADDDTTMPDIVLAQDTDTQYLVDSGVVVAAGDCIAAEPDAAARYETLAPFVRATYTVDGVLWPAAFGVAAPVLYFNRAHLEQAGLDPDDAPSDLDEVRATAEAVKAVRPEGYPVAFRVDSWWIEQLSTAQGDELVDRANGHAGLAVRSEVPNDTVVEVVRWMADMVDDGLMRVFAHSQVADAPMAVLRGGADNSSMLIDTSSAATTLDALLGGEVSGDELGVGELADEPIDIGVGPLPGLGGAGSGQVSGNAWYLVDGEDPATIAAAWDFLQWVNETPQQVTWTVQGSYLPVWQGAVDEPELQRYFAETRPGRWLQVATDGLDAIDPEFPGPLVGPYLQLREALRVALERVLMDGRPVDEELDRADDAVQAALDEYARDVSGG